MTNSKLTFAAAALAAITLAAPAFAQSVDHTGTLQPSYYDASGKQMMGARAARAAQPVLQVQPRQARALYNSVATPVESGPASGFDPSIASQR
jgi:hypothetical protein